MCILPADISSSSILVGGVITSPIKAKVSPTAKTSFAGTMVIVFPDAKCPTPATLAAALPRAYLATPKASPGITMGTTNAVVTMGSGSSMVAVAKMDISGIKGTVLSKAGPAGIAAPTVTATGGTVVTKDSPVKMAPYQVAGRSMAVAGAGCTLAAADGGKSVVYSCPSLQINQPLKLEMGEGAMIIQGNLTATAKVGAPGRAVSGAPLHVHARAKPTILHPTSSSSSSSPARSLPPSWCPPATCPRPCRRPARSAGWQ